MLFFNSPWGFPDRGHSPWAPPKGSETGLKPLGNTFRLTISESLLLRLQHHCFISFFSCRNDVLIFLFWFHCQSIKFSLFSRKRAKPRERPQKGLKPVWNHSETPAAHHLQRSLSPLSLLSLFLSLSLSLSRLLFVSICVSCYPLFRTAACFSGPQCLQLECVLGACFSGPLHVFPDRNVYS